MGVLIVAPFLWSLWPFQWIRPSYARVAEAVALFGLLVGAAWFASRSEGPWLFVVLPPLTWIAWRFQRRGAGFSALIASVIVIIAATDGVGPFVDRSLLESMAILQLFNAAVSFTSFFFAAAVTERQHAMDALYRRQRGIAETIQTSLLPAELPKMPGVSLCARYTPALREARIGGDWYDVFALDETTLGLAVGDVAGHGFGASATMAALRAGLRSYAVETIGPDDVLGRLNHFVTGLYPDVVATVLYARYDTVDCTLDIATAGHPLPLRVAADGTTSVVECPIGPPLGVTSAAGFKTESHLLNVGDTVLAYTDGLVERRDRSVDEGLKTLCELGPTLTSGLESACDVVLASLLGEEIPDDVALLAVRPMSFLGEHLVLKGSSHPGEVPRVRRTLRRWLADNGATSDETGAVLLAASEAHSNAVVHAYEGRVGPIRIDVSAEPPGVVVTVRDYGHWRTEFAPSPDGSNGRGIHMMHALVDTVEITSNRHGTEVRLTAPLAASDSGS
jgi:anti-sigma regulatory factor (Ser/Thr protein kinase)